MVGTCLSVCVVPGPESLQLWPFLWLPSFFLTLLPDCLCCTLVWHCGCCVFLSTILAAACSSHAFPTPLFCTTIHETQHCHLQPAWNSSLYVRGDRYHAFASPLTDSGDALDATWLIRTGCHPTPLPVVRLGMSQC